MQSLRMGAIATLVLTTGVFAQTEWTVEVRDLNTGQGIANVLVEGRSSRVHATTNAQGVATLMVTGDKESVIVHGGTGYNYQVGEYPITGPRVVYLVPDSMFHKTPLIPTTGTGAPVVFQGATQCVFGPNAYTIEIEVPPGVLPEPASFWIAPVPASASPCPHDFDRFVAAAIGQFAIKLVNAQGKEISDVLPEPGIVVRSSPTWYPFSILVPQNQVIKGTQCRLTKTSGRWDAQPDLLTWDPAAGMFTAHLRACSWWLILMPLLLPSSLGSADVPIPGPPPAPKIDIVPSDCCVTGPGDSSPVDCGKLRLPLNAVFTAGTTTSFSAQIAAALTAQLGVAPSELASLITRLTVMVTGSLTLDASFSFTHTCSMTTGGPIPALTMVADPCYSGEMSLTLASRTFTLTCGTHSTQVKFPEQVIKVLCLTLDPSCGTEPSPCNSGPLKKRELSPSSYKICQGDLLSCQ